jgi:outer membrane protein assembly factor BamB
MKKILLLLIILSPLGCSKVDNYFLGEDNTPKPKTLAPIKSKIKLTENWVVPVGNAKKTGNYLKLKPAVVGNTVYTAEPSGVVQAVNKNTGNILWSKKIPSGIVSGPTLADGHIALGTDSSKIIVLKQADGQQIWDADVSGDVLSTPVITQGKLIAKTIDGNLFAFKLASGEKLWVSNHGSPSLILKASSAPVLANNQTILVGYSDGRMDAIDLETGHIIWQKSIAYANGTSDVERLVDITADPIVQGDKVLLGSYQGYVGSLSLQDGQFAWRKPASIYKNMLVQGETLYMTDSKDVVWSINKQNGMVNWKQAGLKARGLTEPVLMNGQLLLGDQTGYLHVLSAKNGEVISRAEVGNPISIAPVVAEGKVYVITNDGKLSRFSIG